MVHKFEELISGYIKNTYGISEDFLSQELVSQLKQHLLSLYAENKFHAAGTGNDSTIQHNKEVRSDNIYWLDPSHNNVYETEFFNQMDDFVNYLNKTCHAGIIGYEFHYAHYKAGSFYKKHLDQFKNNSSRQFSLITYLNENWQESDGGQLLLHLPDQLQHVAPTGGKTIFFKSSELLHEVEISSTTRLSITGWLKRG